MPTRAALLDRHAIALERAEQSIYSDVVTAKTVEVM